MMTDQGETRANGRPVQTLCTLFWVEGGLESRKYRLSRSIFFMSWEAAFQRMAASGKRIAVVDTRGRALALAGWGDHLVGRESALLGLGWVEMAHPDDLPQIFAWFAEEFDSGPMVHRGMWRVDGVVAMVAVGCAKIRCDDVWIVVHSLEPLPLPDAREPRDRCAVAPDLPCAGCSACLLD